MLDRLAADILAKISSVPTLENTTSFTIGGKAFDPALKEIALPACRLLTLSDTPGEDPYSLGTDRGEEVVARVQVQKAMFGALIILPYLDDADYLGIELPLVVAVRMAMQGKESPSGHRWRYFDMHKDFIFPDRLAFIQRYTVTWVL